MGRGDGYCSTVRAFSRSLATVTVLLRNPVCIQLYVFTLVHIVLL